MNKPSRTIGASASGVIDNRWGQPVGQDDQRTRFDPTFWVQRNLMISKPLDDRLEQLANKNGTTQGEVLRKALVLFEVANEARGEGHKLGILSQDHQVLAEIVGL